jgi:hypothetical protein
LHWNWGGIIGSLCAECAGLRVAYPKSDGTVFGVVSFCEQKFDEIPMRAAAKGR